MTWYCPDWPRNIDDAYAWDEEDSADLEDLTDAYSCSRFGGSVYVTVDASDDTLDHGETDTVRCVDHNNRDGVWDEAEHTYWLERHGHPTCGDCERTYRSTEALERHQETDEEPEEHYRPIERPLITTTHSSWAQ